MFYLSIDQGTTGTTAALICKKKLSFVDKVNIEFKQHFPYPGQVEHDLNDIWESVTKSVTQLFEKNNIDSTSISSIGITNQRETTCCFTRSGAPLAKAIVWQDRRTHARCSELSNEYSSTIKEKTGLPVDPYFSGSKIEWLIKNNQDVQNALAKDDCLFGTIDTFLIYKLTGHKSFTTEPSNASRTLIFNINDNCWDDELCEIFSIPKNCLPNVQDSFSTFGVTDELSFIKSNIPITGCLGDQQSALFGQSCFDEGQSKCTYGTGAFFLINTGNEKIESTNGLLTTIAYCNEGNIYYALEGSSYIAGAAVQWLRDNLNIITTASEIEGLALKSNDEKMKNVMFLPFFTGVASPYWIADAQAAITGLTRDTGKPEIARACLEGIAMAIDDLLSSVIKDIGKGPKELRVDGGATLNNLLLQIQSNFSKINIVRPKVVETTAYGAALAAAVGSKDISLNDISKLWVSDKVFEAQTSNYYSDKKKKWNSTIEKLYL
jgi:glycerol kinase